MNSVISVKTPGKFVYMKPGGVVSFYFLKKVDLGCACGENVDISYTDNENVLKLTIRNVVKLYVENIEYPDTLDTVFSNGIPESCHCGHDVVECLMNEIAASTFK